MKTKYPFIASFVAGFVVAAAALFLFHAATGTPGLGRGAAAADLDHNGEITRAEWTKVANQRFDALDKNKDGKIVIGEIPPGPGPDGPGPGGFRHHGPRDGGPDGWDRNAPPPPPPAAAQATSNTATPAAQ
jgi:hypothetical protein